LDECEKYGSDMYSGSEKVEKVIVNMNEIENKKKNNKKM
jgi:hypothetical protein